MLLWYIRFITFNLHLYLFFLLWIRNIVFLLIILYFRPLFITNSFLHWWFIIITINFTYIGFSFFFIPLVPFIYFLVQYLWLVYWFLLKLFTPCLIISLFHFFWRFLWIRHFSYVKIVIIRYLFIILYMLEFQMLTQRSFWAIRFLAVLYWTSKVSFNFICLSSVSFLFVFRKYNWILILLSF